MGVARLAAAGGITSCSSAVKMAAQLVLALNRFNVGTGRKNRDIPIDLRDVRQRSSSHPASKASPQRPIECGELRNLGILGKTGNQVARMPCGSEIVGCLGTDKFRTIGAGHRARGHQKVVPRPHAIRYHGVSRDCSTRIRQDHTHARLGQKMALRPVEQASFRSSSQFIAISAPRCKQ